MIIVVARFRPQPGRRAELVALLEETQTASRADRGCLAYGYYADVADPESLIAVEEWEDQGALAEHLAQPHIARLVAAIPDLVAGRPDVRVHEVAATEPIRRPPHGG